MSRSSSRLCVLATVLLACSCAAPRPAVEDVIDAQDDPLSAAPTEARRSESILDLAREHRIPMKQDPQLLQRNVLGKSVVTMTAADR